LLGIATLGCTSCTPGYAYVVTVFVSAPDDDDDDDDDDCSSETAVIMAVTNLESNTK